MTKNIFIYLIIALLSFSADDARAVKVTGAGDREIMALVNQLPAINSMELERIMTEICCMGKPAVLSIASSLVPPGGGDDTKHRYAISGLVRHASRGDDKEAGKLVSAALCEAIGNAAHDEVKDFLLQELQYVADEEAVSTAASFLSHPRLCDPAARVLIRINSGSAKRALTGGLYDAGLSEQVIIVQAIGDTRFEVGAVVLRNLSSTTDPVLKKVILRTLAETADLQSAGLLAGEAAKAGYNYEPTEATASWLHFLTRIAEKGDRAFVENALKDIVSDQKIPLHTRNAALGIIR
jgi:hypothetical protein